MIVSITIPVFNEESCLTDSLRRLQRFLSRGADWDWEIVVADNGSTDRTKNVAEDFAKSLALQKSETGRKASAHPELCVPDCEFQSRGVRIVSLAEKGRGRALKQVWLSSVADLLVYMDADLSTDLEALPRLVEALVEKGIHGSVMEAKPIKVHRRGSPQKQNCGGPVSARGFSMASGGTLPGYDIAVGSRLLRPKLTTRSIKRELISRCYNHLIRLMFRTHFSDAQCGFKAVTREAAQVLLPQIQDNEWFFDTELLILAEYYGYRIFDLPVRWIERRETHVKIFPTAVQDTKGLLRLRRTLSPSRR